MIEFSKILQKNKSCFQFFKVTFPKISDAKIKEAIFVGSQIRQLLDNENFEATMDELEQATWHAKDSWEMTKKLSESSQWKSNATKI